MTETIILKVSKEFKQELEKKAKEKNLKLSSYIRLVLSEKKKDDKRRIFKGFNGNI